MAESSTGQAEQPALAMLWENPDIRAALVQRIRTREHNDATPSEEALVDEYVNSWREAFVTKDVVKLVMSHPGLLKEDYQQIERVMDKQKHQKLYWAGIGTLGTFFVYNVGFKSSPLFYNFFQKKTRFGILRFFKRFVGTYAVFLANVYATDYIFNQQFKLWLIDSKLVEKYHLNYAVSDRE